MPKIRDEADIPVVKAEVVADKPQRIKPRVSIDEYNAPEIVDYSVGDEIELVAKARVRGINEHMTEKNMVSCDLELTEVKITNLKESRKESLRMGLDKKDYDDLQKKKKKIENI